MITALIVGILARRQVAARREVSGSSPGVDDLITVLHDQLGHRLALLNMYAATLARRARLTAPEQEQVVEAIQSNAQEAARTLATLLTEGPCSTLTPLEDLDQLLADFRRAGIAVYEHRGDGVEQLNLDALTFLFCFARECLTNAAKHGAGGFVYLHAVYAPHSQRLFASCSSAQPHVAGPIDPPSSRLGLAALKEQAEMLGGDVEARSEGDRFLVRTVVKARPATHRHHRHSAERGDHVSHL
ncbi:sensor histidine kinase [Microbacterium sp. AG790]|uniref:sensor histidine kinase n=1 Tax=Microbacterium sp. AG790 TaxID=2183995 RepID=UPI0011C4653A|nr:hypothetical protein [Microbacterium sp. AG790]